MKWARITTSNWHILHSIRAGTMLKWDGPRGAYDHVPYEFILTQDGYDFPTERFINFYKPDEGSRPTGAKVWEGEGLPKGPICKQCSSFVRLLKESVSIDDVR